MKLNDPSHDFYPKPTFLGGGEAAPDSLVISTGWSDTLCKIKWHKPTLNNIWKGNKTIFISIFGETYIIRVKDNKNIFTTLYKTKTYWK